MSVGNLITLYAIQIPAAEAEASETDLKSVLYRQIFEGVTIWFRAGVSQYTDIGNNHATKNQDY